MQWTWNITTETSWLSSGFTCKTVFFAVIFHCLVDDLHVLHFSMYFPNPYSVYFFFLFFLIELHKCCICVIYKNNVAIQTLFMQILKLNRKIWTSFWFHIIVDTKNLCNFLSVFFILYFKISDDLCTSLRIKMIAYVNYWLNIKRFSYFELVIQ